MSARAGTLSIMVGGDQAVFDAVRPCFDVMGKTIVLQGPAGSGQHTKLVNQTLVAGNIVAVCEALLYAQRAGLDVEKVLASVSSGAAASWALSNLAPRMVAGDYAPGFFVDHFVKDMEIALDEAARKQLVLPGLALARRAVRRAPGAGPRPRRHAGAHPRPRGDVTEPQGAVMRIILSDFMSLDGVVQAPGGKEEDTDGGFKHGGWSMPFFDPEAMGAGDRRGDGADRRAALRPAHLAGDGRRVAGTGRRSVRRPHERDPEVRRVADALPRTDLDWNNSTLLPPDDVFGAVRDLKEPIGRRHPGDGQRDPRASSSSRTISSTSTAS